MDRPSKTIPLMAIVATDWITSHIKKASLDPAHPLPLLPNQICMVNCTNGITASNPITGAIEINGKPGDTLRFYMQSEYNNCQTTVVHYRLTGRLGSAVGINESQGIIQQGTTPQPTTFSPPACEDAEVTSTYFTAPIAAPGKQEIHQSFALYIAVRGQDDPQLFGYFVWQPIVVVK